MGHDPLVCEQVVRSKSAVEEHGVGLLCFTHLFFQKQARLIIRAIECIRLLLFRHRRLLLLWIISLLLNFS